MYVMCTHSHAVRIAESRESVTVDYTGQIRSFSEIGPGGPHFGPNIVTPRPWVCYVEGKSIAAQWQTPNGSVVPTVPLGFTQADGSELYQTSIVGNEHCLVVLIRGPDYNSPDGEYCCVKTDPSQKRCVTLSECVGALKY